MRVRRAELRVPLPPAQGLLHTREECYQGQRKREGEIESERDSDSDRERDGDSDREINSSIRKEGTVCPKAQAVLRRKLAF